MTGLREKLADAGRSLREVFRNPALRRLELAFAGSIVGDWAYATAVAVYAYEQGGPTAVGLLGVARYVSMAVIVVVRPASDACQSPATVSAWLARSISTASQPSEPATSLFQ